MISRLIATAAIAVLVTVALTSRSGAAAQAPAPAPANQEVLSALLVEVRGLRAAMEQMASAGPRVQLAFGRLQMHEQRITASLRKLDALRSEISGLDAAVERSDSDAKEIDERIRDPQWAQSRDEYTARLRDVQQSKVRTLTQLQRLRADENVLQNEIAADQARWVEANRLLEELDRSLARR
jgi:chromosome segregation ATPase